MRAEIKIVTDGATAVCWQVCPGLLDVLSLIIPCTTSTTADGLNDRHAVNDEL